MWEEKRDLRTGEPYSYNCLTGERRSLADHDFGQEVTPPFPPSRPSNSMDHDYYHHPRHPAHTKRKEKPPPQYPIIFVGSSSLMDYSGQSTAPTWNSSLTATSSRPQSQSQQKPQLHQPQHQYSRTSSGDDDDEYDDHNRHPRRRTKSPKKTTKTTPKSKKSSKPQKKNWSKKKSSSSNTSKTKSTRQPPPPPPPHRHSSILISDSDDDHDHDDSDSNSVYFSSLEDGDDEDTQQQQRRRRRQRGTLQRRSRSVSSRSQSLSTHRSKRSSTSSRPTTRSKSHSRSGSPAHRSRSHSYDSSRSPRSRSHRPSRANRSNSNSNSRSRGSNNRNHNNSKTRMRSRSLSSLSTMSRRSRGTSASSYDDDPHHVQRKQKKKLYREAGVMEEDYSHYSHYSGSHYSGSRTHSERRGSTDHRSSTSTGGQRQRNHNRVYDVDVDVSLSTSDDDDDDDDPHQHPDSSSRRTPPTARFQERAAMATSVLLQLEQQQRVLEARQKQILKREKAMAKERKALAKQRQEEEEMRQLKETLDELERREQLEKEEQGRERVARAEMKRQIKKAERKALKAAQEAEKARRKAEEEVEQAQRKAAQLETARLIAEEETERAKRQAAAETDARRRAQAEAIHAKREADARIWEMNRQVQASKALLNETAEKLREAEQKAAQHAALTETEAQRAKRQTAAEADARRRAQAEAVQAKREAEARIQEMNQQIQASKALLNETADKLRETERKATLDATQTEMETLRSKRQAAVEADGRQNAQAEAILAKMEADARILEMDRQVQALLNQSADKLREAERKAEAVHQEQGNDVSMIHSEEIGTEFPLFRGSREYSIGNEVSSLPKSTRMEKMYESSLVDVQDDSSETSSDESSSEDEEYSLPEPTVPSTADTINVGERGSETESDDEVVISSESGSDGRSSDEEEYSASESDNPMTHTTGDDGEHMVFSESEYSESELESDGLEQSTPPNMSKHKGSGMEVSMDLEDVFNSEDAESPLTTPPARKTKKLFIKKNQVSERQLLKTSILPVQNGSSLKEESMELNDVFNANSPLKTNSPRKKNFFDRDRQQSKKTKKNTSGSSDLGKSLSESGHRDSHVDKKTVKTKPSMNASMPGHLESRRPKVRRALSSLETGKAPRGVHPLRKGSSMDGSRFFSWNKSHSDSRVTEDNSPDGKSSRIRSPKKLNESRSYISGKAGLDDTQSIDFNASRANMSLTNSRLTGLATPRRGVNPNNPRVQMSRMDSRMQMSRMDSRLQMSHKESRMQMSRNDSHKNMGSSHSRMNMSGNDSRVSISWDIESQRTKKKFERPPKSLVLIWLLFAGEMGFDLATTSVAFRSLLDDDRCCGKRIDMGQIPMSATIPFFCLVSTEIALLLRAIILTLFPSLGEAEQHQPDGEPFKRNTFMRYVCCCLRLNVAIIMRILSIVVLLNPFFGCVIAWILLYQSNKKEAFMVLGFEGGSLLLHYISVMIEGAIVNLWTLFLHGLIPLIPFSVAIGLTMFYLKQGGVCYLVADKVFMFNGCEICLDGYPPVKGLCRFQNGTTYPFKEQNALRDLAGASDLKDLTARTTQVSYCADENPGGPDVNFCFFDFEDGLLASVIQANATQPQSIN